MEELREELAATLNDPGYSVFALRHGNQYEGLVELGLILARMRAVVPGEFGVATNQATSTTHYAPAVDANAGVASTTPSAGRDGPPFRPTRQASASRLTLTTSAPSVARIQVP